MLLSVAYKIGKKKDNRVETDILFLVGRSAESVTVKSDIASIGGNAEYRIREDNSSVEDTERLG